MNKKSGIYLTLCFIMLTGCEFFAERNSIQETFLWQEVTSIPGNEIYYSHQIGDNVLVSTDEGAFLYDPVGKNVEQYFNDSIFNELGYNISISEGSAYLSKAKEFNNKTYIYITDGNTIVRDSNINLLIEVTEGGDDRSFNEILNLNRRFFDFWINPAEDVLIGSEFGTFFKHGGSDEIFRNRFLGALTSLFPLNIVQSLYLSPSGFSIAGASDGVYSSDDFGHNWSPAQESFPSSRVGIRYMSENKQTGELWAIGSGALMISVDMGTTWNMFYGVSDHTKSMFIDAGNGFIYYNSNKKRSGEYRGIVSYNLNTQENDEYIGPQQLIHQFGFFDDDRAWASSPEGFFIGSPIRK